MLQQLLDDLRGYFESKPSLTEVEQALLDRLKEDIFPILFLQRDALAQTGFDVRRISAERMRRLALRIAEDYCQSETSAGENLWEELEEMAEALHLPRCPRCPACDHCRTIFDAQEDVLRCEVCDQTWHEELYVLAEFPEDSSYFEENAIGYPSFNSEDNGARYVPEYDYIRHFHKDPAENAYYKPLRWPESQSYLFPDEPNESIDALNEPVQDEKGIADFGEQAVWVPLCHLKI
ncbi:hypothetical protein [Alistipes ihumii]|uniref:hypothetical protein n=1 Tax=Alistipes ihumii TaxID=1470347 RepID=UPI00266CA632|nr:hypothetical protein [Alistipes ihumii]